MNKYIINKLESIFDKINIIEIIFSSIINIKSCSYIEKNNSIYFNINCDQIYLYQIIFHGIHLCFKLFNINYIFRNTKINIFY
jgi:hypothetical protein